jgi:hypothetical protein
VLVEFSSSACSHSKPEAFVLHLSTSTKAASIASVSHNSERTALTRNAFGTVRTTASSDHKTIDSRARTTTRTVARRNTLRSTGCEADWLLLEALTQARLLPTFQLFMTSEYSLPCSQEPLLSHTPTSVPHSLQFEDQILQAMRSSRFMPVLHTQCISSSLNIRWRTQILQLLTALLSPAPCCFTQHPVLIVISVLPVLLRGTKFSLGPFFSKNRFTRTRFLRSYAQCVWRVVSVTTHRFSLQAVVVAMHETEVTYRTEHRQPTTQAYWREQFSLIREMGLNCTTNLKTSVQQNPLKWTLARDVDRQPSLLSNVNIKFISFQKEGATIPTLYSLLCFYYRQLWSLFIITDHYTTVQGWYQYKWCRVQDISGVCCCIWTEARFKQFSSAEERNATWKNSWWSRYSLTVRSLRLACSTFLQSDLRLIRPAAAGLSGTNFKVFSSAQYYTTSPYSNTATALEDPHYWNPSQRLKQPPPPHHHHHGYRGFYPKSIIVEGSDDSWIMQWSLFLNTTTRLESSISKADTHCKLAVKLSDLTASTQANCGLTQLHISALQSWTPGDKAPCIPDPDTTCSLGGDAENRHTYPCYRIEPPSSNRLTSPISSSTGGTQHPEVSKTINT